MFHLFTIQNSLSFLYMVYNIKVMKDLLLSELCFQYFTHKDNQLKILNLTYNKFFLL